MTPTKYLNLSKKALVRFYPLKLLIIKVLIKKLKGLESKAFHMHMHLDYRPN